MATRRDFLSLSALMACAATLSRSTAFAQPRPTMLTRPIPSTNEAVPVVGLGTWQAFDVGADRAELDQRKEVLRVLLEASGKVMNSSPMYGRAEAVVGTLLSELRDRNGVSVALGSDCDRYRCRLNSRDGSCTRLLDTGGGGHIRAWGCGKGARMDTRYRSAMMVVRRHPTQGVRIVQEGLKDRVAA